MDCRLQVFKAEPSGNSQTKSYRFAVVDCTKTKQYPANFVCILPVKVDLKNKNNSSAFGTLFGERSIEVAVELLNAALKSENDKSVKDEIERRMKLLAPNQKSVLKCSVCQQSFKSNRTRKYKKTICEDCLKKRYNRYFEAKPASLHNV